jgi:hypothetical protein
MGANGRSWIVADSGWMIFSVAKSDRFRNGGTKHYAGSEVGAGRGLRHPG